jgi:hypothetical protein
MRDKKFRWSVRGTFILMALGASSAFADCPDLLHPWKCEPQYRTPVGRKFLRQMQETNPYMRDIWIPDPAVKLTVRLKGTGTHFSYTGIELSGTLGNQDPYTPMRDKFRYRIATNGFSPDLNTLMLSTKGVDAGQTLRDAKRVQALSQNGFNPKSLSSASAPVPVLKAPPGQASARRAPGSDERNCAVCEARSRVGVSPFDRSAQPELELPTLLNRLLLPPASPRP